ncbi:MAG: PAS domain-containing protein, partial [Pseudomonadales bacterium]|nr:PAS domain-containing protein [Pseudomonadales bacterium]
MKFLEKMSTTQRNMLIAAMPTIGMLIFMMGSWDYVSAAVAAEGGSTTGLLIIPCLLAIGAFAIAFMGGSSGDTETERLEQALETCQANVMVADADMNIQYMNKSVVEMLRNNESQLRKALPNFSVDTLLGGNVDMFHANPSHQRRMISGLNSVLKTDIEVSDLTFGLVATPIFSKTGQRTGTVVEWYDRTEELAKQKQEQNAAAENKRIVKALQICDTSVMVADSDMNIIFMNDAVQRMMEEAQEDLRQELPNFDASKLMGENADVFHKNPAHQRGMISKLKDVYRGQIEVGNLTFRLIATPLIDEDGSRIGTVVEWDNLTEELALQREQQEAANSNLRVRQALDNVSTNTMIADDDGQIVYMNDSVQEMLVNAQTDIRKELAGFDATNLLGKNFDEFHKNPAHQRNLLANLRGTYKTQIEVGGRTFRLVANPMMNDQNERIGSVVEWADRTEEVAVEKQVSELVTAATSGNLEHRIETAGKEGFFLNLSEGLNSLVGVTEEVIADTARVLDALAHGNLTEKIDKEYNGSYKKLKDDANATVDKLIEIIGNVVNSANAVTNGADEIAQGNADLSQRTEEQASSLEETASSMEEMTSAVRQSSENAGRASQLAEEARDQATRGGEVVSNAVDAMAQINASS